MHLAGGSAATFPVAMAFSDDGCPIRMNGHPDSGVIDRQKCPANFAGMYGTGSDRLRRPGLLSHLHSLIGYDEPEILPSKYPSNCLAMTDGGHGCVVYRQHCIILATNSRGIPILPIAAAVRFGQKYQVI